MVIDLKVLVKSFFIASTVHVIPDEGILINNNG